jgi:hypothetical protein
VHLVETYVGFYYPRLSRSDPWRIFGHVEVWGYTRDDTWVFLNPQRVGTSILVTHHKDEVLDLWTSRVAMCDEIWRVAGRRELAMPSLAPLTCIGIVAHIHGCRAWTYPGLRAKLRALGAEKVCENTEREPGGQGRSAT